VAAQCTVSYRLALYPGQSPLDVAARVEAVVAAAAAANPFLSENPPRVRYDGFRCEGFTLPPDEPVAVTLADTYRRVVGTEAPLAPTTATTDARHFVRRGIPAVCFGPLAEEIHGIDERVSIASMERAAQVLAVFVRDWCGLVSD
jgi:acetylornithine deacetylase